MNDLLRNYRQLVARVDALCDRVNAQLAPYLQCRRGCDSCCRHLRLFPVEAAALRTAAQSLSPAARQELARQLQQGGAAETGPCPLLQEGACLLYAARPLICRTHGLPLLVRREERDEVDCCPLNLQGLERLPAEAVLNLESLNAALVAINALYLKESGAFEERRLIAELLADLDCIAGGLCSN